MKIEEASEAGLLVVATHSRYFLLTLCLSFLLPPLQHMASCANWVMMQLLGQPIAADISELSGLKCIFRKKLDKEI